MIMAVVLHLLVFLVAIFNEGYGTPREEQMSSSGDNTSPSGDNEPDDPDTVCINPFNSSSTATAELFTNHNDAMKYGQCLSACIEELFGDSITAQKNGLSLSDSYIWASDLQTDCNFTQKMFYCSRGCYHSHTINSSASNCTRSCFESCRNKSDADCYACEEHVCLLGCSIVLASRSKDIITPPTLSPLVVTETTQLGIYSVNFTHLADSEETGSGLSTEGSGLSSINILTLILRIVIGHGTPNVTTVFINKPGIFTLLDLREYSCNQVMVSYSWISKNGMSSNDSPAVSIHIKGVNVSQPLSVNPSSIRKSYQYDWRRGYFGHYVVNVSWANPSDTVSIARYEIHLDHITNFNHCRSGVYEVLPHYNEARTVYIIRANDPSQAPISHCQYGLRIISIPAHSSFDPVQTGNYLSVPKYVPDSFQLTCNHYLNAQGIFQLNFTLIISPYLVQEKIVETVSVIPDLIEYDDARSRILDQDSGILVELPVPPNMTNLSYTISQNFLPKSTNNFEYDFTVTLDWIFPIIYTPQKQLQKCSFNPLSPQPDVVTALSLLSPIVRPSAYKIDLIVTWKPPITMNGLFELYQFCLVATPFSPSSELPQGNQIPIATVSNISQTDLNWTALFFPSSDQQQYLYLHIRAKNTYRYGNWSTPLAIALDNAQTSSSIIPTTVISSSATDLTSSVSVYSSLLVSSANGYSINAVPPSVTVEQANAVNISLTASTTIIVLIALVVIVMIGGLCVHWQLRRRKRRIEFTQEDIFSDPIFRSMGPRAALTFPVENGITQDMWEIPASMVIIECEIGQGEFGEVYKGIITDPMVTPRVRKVLKESYSNSVAVKLLKTTASGSERRDFLHEIDLMKLISQGNNSHVVNMIGCVTLQEPLCLITEYVKYGDLLSYLRANRKTARDENGHNPYPDLEDLQSIDLLSFAYQIASGMEFLSSLDIVHRDLACRNVLVGEGKALKVSDYGMSRMVGAGDTYVKTTKGKLPLKWMAIESINDREFTTASDVWAYGVTLWEIGTLGGFPYPAISNDELLSRLKQGYRMDCPDNCSREIYDIMLECWREAPCKRPSFAELRLKFDHLLTAQHESNAYIDLRTNESNDIYSVPIEEDEEEEEQQQQESIKPSPCRSKRSLSPCISLKSFSPSYCSISSITETENMRVTNPLFLEVEIHPSPQRLNGSIAQRLSPRISRSPQRPTSLAMWDMEGGVGPIRENCYVDEPAVMGNGPSGIIIQVSSSTPTTPTH